MTTNAEQMREALETIASLYEKNMDAPIGALADLMYDSRCIARTALAALSSPAPQVSSPVPDGCALVPIAPTPEMRAAGWRKLTTRIEIDDRDMEPAYRAMLDAAPAINEAVPAQPKGWDAEFLSKRLSRVAKLVGIPMPDGTHEQIAEVAGTILGQIARKLEPSQREAAQPAPVPVAWIATDLDGHGDVAFTQEDAKRRAGSYCEHLIPLYDTALPPQSQPVNTQQITDAALEEAAIRFVHDFAPDDRLDPAYIAQCLQSMKSSPLPQGEEKGGA